MPVPPHLQDRHYNGAAALGRGLDYKYAHDYPNHYVKQQYLPDGMEGAVFYEPSDNGYEKEIKARLAFLRGSEAVSYTHLDVYRRQIYFFIRKNTGSS